MGFVKLARKRTFGGFYICELLVAAFAVVAGALYQYLRLEPRAPLQLYLSRIATSIGTYVAALLVTLLLLRLQDIRKTPKGGQVPPHRFTWNQFRGRYLLWQNVGVDLRFLNISCLLFVLFINLKHLTPLVNPHLFDRILLRVDLSLCKGRTAAEVLIGLIGPDWAPVLSQAYMLFFPYVLMLIFVMILQDKRDLAQEFFAAFCAVWLVGALCIFAFPTLGPVYMRSGLLDLLPPDTSVANMQLQLYRQKMVLDARPLHPTAVFLISGFPSLHLAVPILGSLYLRRVNWKLGVISWAFAAVTVVTTIYFGWHYILDDVGGALLALLVYRAVQRYYAPIYVYVPEQPAAGPYGQPGMGYPMPGVPGMPPQGYPPPYAPGPAGLPGYGYPPQSSGPVAGSQPGPAPRYTSVNPVIDAEIVAPDGKSGKRDEDE